MVEILQNKNSATRFQILVEIATSDPNIQQKSIAAKLDGNLRSYRTKYDLAGESTQEHVE